MTERESPAGFCLCLPLANVRFRRIATSPPAVRNVRFTSTPARRNAQKAAVQATAPRLRQFDLL